MKPRRVLTKSHREQSSSSYADDERSECGMSDRHSASGGGDEMMHDSDSWCVEDSYPLRIYTDEQHKQRAGNINPEDPATKAYRLPAINPLLAAFNTGDFEALTNLLRERCNPQVILSAPSWQCHAYGVPSLLVFWSLLHELHPDAIMTVLERRMRSAFSPHTNCVDQSAEYVCKFAGTRITAHPMAAPFQSLLLDPALGDGMLPHDQLSLLVIRHLSTISPSLFQEQTCVYILEMSLAFDREERISELAVSVLATTIQ